MLESALQGVTLLPGESLAFGIRAGYLEGDGYWLQTMWVDSEVDITVSSPSPLNLTITTDPAGNESFVTGAGQYDLGDTATVTAADFTDCPNGVVYVFDHWVGDVADEFSASTSITISSDTALTAVYAATAECGDACHPVSDSSLNGDCFVNDADLQYIADNWLASSLD
jgi:hypothetical protein